MSGKRFLLLAVIAGAICLGGGCKKSIAKESSTIIESSTAETNQDKIESTSEIDTDGIETAAEEKTEDILEISISETAVPVHIGISEAEEKEKKIILLGDSRSVGLYCSMIYSEDEYPSHIFYHIAPDYTGTYENTTFIVKAGEGYSWFSACGMPLAEQYIDEDTVIVVWFGVNDLGSMDRYIDFMNTKVLSYGVPVYYMTIGPCDKHWEYQTEDVNHFNIGLLTLLDQQIGVIDANSFIRQGMEDGTFSTMDGLHYDYNTSRAIYEYILEEIDANSRKEEIVTSSF